MPHDFPRFTRNLAPVPDYIDWEGTQWECTFKILSNEEELALIADAANGEPEQRTYLETLYRVTRALATICGDPVVGSVQQRYAQGMTWVEPFTWKVAEAYSRAREKLITSRQALEADPKAAAGPGPSGNASGRPANSAAGPSVSRSSSSPSSTRSGT